VTVAKPPIAIAKPYPAKRVLSFISFHH
jgi:hypothetical protein